MNLLSPEQVLFIHDRMIEETGGTHGLRDPNLLEAACARPRQGIGDVELFPSIHDKAAAVMQAIIQYHPFVDGNKRTGITVAGMILWRNGWELDIPFQDGYAFILRVAGEDPAGSPRVDWQQISAWLGQHSRPFTR
jgi:death on curing protein